MCRINLFTSSLFRTVILNHDCTVESRVLYMHHRGLCLSSRDSDLIGLGCGQGIGNFENFPGNFNVQLKLRATGRIMGVHVNSTEL